MTRLERKIAANYRLTKDSSKICDTDLEFAYNAKSFAFACTVFLLVLSAVFLDELESYLCFSAFGQ